MAELQTLPAGENFLKVREKLADRPVHSIIGQVLDDVCAGKVTIVAARTNSGKTMMLPGALADKTGKQVLVMVPRRLLATDAAMNVAELSETQLGDKVGFALGQVNGEKSLHHPDTKILYCTYGYALRSGLINTADIIVLDEVHEGDEHISLARAVLHERKKKEPSLRILEMSATVNAKAQAAHWNDVAETSIHRAEGSEHPCDLIAESPMRPNNEGRSIEQVVIGLLNGEGPMREYVRPAPIAADKEPAVEDFGTLLDAQEHAQNNQGSRGIAVFRGGIKEVENTVTELKRLLVLQGIANVEVVGIHSGTPGDERHEARKPPKDGCRKIIVGTNVIESGVNLRWVDAGVSDGVRKVPHYREDSGAHALVAEDLTQAGILQQMGRINRDPESSGFKRGVFILHAKNTFAQRPIQSGPAIERESILAPAFHAASLGYDPTTLKWDISPGYAGDLRARLDTAKQDLMRLELVNDDWSLTKEGAFITKLPVSPEAGAMLNEAHRLDILRLRTKEEPRVLRDAVILAAISENTMLKANSKKSFKLQNHDVNYDGRQAPPGGDQHKTSDLLDAFNAYRAICKTARAAHIVPTVVYASNEAAIAVADMDQLRHLRQQRNDLQVICANYNMNVNGFIQVAQLVEEINKRLNKLPGITIEAPPADDIYETARYDDIKQCILNGSVNKLYLMRPDGCSDLMRDYGRKKRANGQLHNGYEIAESSVVKLRTTDTLVTGKLREVLPKRERATDEKGGRNNGKKAAGQEHQEPLLVLDGVSVIPLDVLLRLARSREECFNPIIHDARFEDGRLSGTYAGKADFDIPVVTIEAERDARFIAFGSEAVSLTEPKKHKTGGKHGKKPRDGWRNSVATDLSDEPAVWGK